MSKPLFLFFSFLPCAISAFAYDLPDKPQHYVSDYAQMISAPVRSRLEQTLKNFEQSTSNQIVVVTLPNLGGEVIEPYSIKLADHWKIGQKGKDNGVILLISRDDRQMRIEVGYGLEAVIPDALAKRIIENEMVPSFKQGRFDEGISNAVEALIKASQGSYRPEPKGAMLKGDWLVFTAIFSFFAGSILQISHAVLIVILCILAAIISPFFNPFYGLYFMIGGFIVLVTAIMKIIWPSSLEIDRQGTSRRRSRYSGGSNSDSWGSSGFSGGGGSFGGGGASGKW